MTNKKIHINQALWFDSSLKLAILRAHYERVFFLAYFLKLV